MFLELAGIFINVITPVFALVVIGYFARRQILSRQTAKKPHSDLAEYDLSRTTS